MIHIQQLVGILPNRVNIGILHIQNGIQLNHDLFIAVSLPFSQQECGQHLGDQREDANLLLIPHPQPRTLVEADEAAEFLFIIQRALKG